MLFDQRIILKTVGISVDYYDEPLPVEEVLATTENITDIDDRYKSILVIEHETTVLPDDKDQVESSSDDIIELNVGGQSIRTFRSTLTAVPNSKLALLFTKNENKLK